MPGTLLPDAATAAPYLAEIDKIETLALANAKAVFYGSGLILNDSLPLDQSKEDFAPPLQSHN